MRSLPADAGVNPADAATSLDGRFLVWAAQKGYLLMTSVLIKAGASLPEGGISEFIQLVNCGSGDVILPVSS